jgi:hypothetical protein
MLNMQGLTDLPNALMTGFREPSDDEWDAGITALEAVLGPIESARQSWRRRLVIMASGEWRLTVNECGFLSAGALIQFTPGSVDAFPVALPIADAVLLLRSKDNPELELQRRRTWLAELNARHQKQAADEMNRQREAVKQQQDAAERAKTYRWDQWAQLVPWQQFAYSLALAVDGGEDLASALRRIAGSVRSFHGERAEVLPPPSRQWWA